MLVTLGVRLDDQRVVLDLRLAGEESAASWSEVVASLVARHLKRPVAVIDGNPGLAMALRTHWSGTTLQRCTAQYADLRIMPNPRAPACRERVPALRRSA